MKKIFLASAAVLAMVAFTSCGSSKESAYRKAYEKAKAQEMAQSQNAQNNQNTSYVETVQQDNNVETPVVTQLEEVSPQQRVVDNNDNVPVRKESLKVVKGAGLKAYSVVVGSFGVRANAEGLQQRLVSAGYNAQVAFNAANNMYRVVISTFDSKANAVESRNSIRATYPDSWLLMNQ